MKVFHTEKQICQTHKVGFTAEEFVNQIVKDKPTELWCNGWSRKKPFIYLDWKPTGKVEMWYNPVINEVHHELSPQELYIKIRNNITDIHYNEPEDTTDPPQ